MAPSSKLSRQPKRRRTGPSEALRSAPSCFIFAFLTLPSPFAYVWMERPHPWIHVMMLLRLVIKRHCMQVSQQAESSSW